MTMTDNKYSLHDIENIKRAKVDKEYLGELILHNEDLIWFSIHNYVGDPIKLAQYNLMEKEDIRQVAMIGFINAVRNFDPSKGILFTTYAPAIIAGEVKGYLRDKGRIIKLPRSAHELNVRVMNYTKDLYYDKYIPAEKVAEEIGEDTDKVRKVLTIGSIPVLIPLRKKERYKTVKNYEEESFFEIEDEYTNVEEEVVDKVYLDQLMEAVRSRLNERDKRILDAKLKGETHEEIAERENISKITVTRTLNKIREIIKEIE